MIGQSCQMEGTPMRIVYIAVLLLPLTAGCVHVKPDAPVSEPDTSEPPKVVAQPSTPPPPAAKPAAPATPTPPAKPAPPATPRPSAKPAAPATPPSKPATASPSARAPAPQAATKAAPPAAKTSVAPALDLKTLETQLKETKAIGLFTKIALKNQVDDLLDQFRDYYEGKTKLKMTDLRRSYDLLMMKVLSLLQDEDQKLASDIVSSREAIWSLLADPKKFATLQG